MAIPEKRGDRRKGDDAVGQLEFEETRRETRRRTQVLDTRAKLAGEGKKL